MIYLDLYTYTCTYTVIRLIPNIIYYSHCNPLFKISTIFEKDLNLWKTDVLTLFQKFILQSVSILAIVSHSHFRMGSNRLSSTALQYKTIMVQLPKIDICFWDFQNHLSISGIMVFWRFHSNCGPFVILTSKVWRKLVAPWCLELVSA